MRHYRSLICIFLLLSIGISGCGRMTKSAADAPIHSMNSNPSEGETGDDTDAIADSYYDHVWHADVDFSELQYYRYDISELDEYIAPIYDFAENGGTDEEFIDADNALYEEIVNIYLLYTLVDLQSYKDATDEETLEESYYMQELWVDAYDAYYTALHALAVSDYSELLESVYPGDYIEIFEDYTPMTQDEKDILSQEEKLVQDYYTIMAASNPDYDAAAELYVELVNTRKLIAGFSGYDSYIEYAYEAIYSRDYSPEDAQQVWQGVKDYIVPVIQRYSDEVLNAAHSLYSSTRLDCSPDAIFSTMETVLPQISDELVTAYQYMKDYHLYDIEFDDDKVNAGFTTVLYGYNEPFIFNAPYNAFFDYSDTYHEFGHFVNRFYTESDLLYGAMDMDLAELQSQGMEVLFSFFYDDLFDSDTAETMKNYMLLDMAYSIVEGALYDEFQQTVYAQSDLTVEQVRDIFIELSEEYGYEVYEGSENDWIDVTHNFDSPFYYISYAVSALGALEIYDLCADDWSRGVDMYMRASAMDTEYYYYSEALEILGLPDFFSESTYRDIADAMRTALGNT